MRGPALEVPAARTRAPEVRLAPGRGLGAASLALAAALPLAWLIGRAHALAPGQEERAVTLVAAGMAALAALSAAVYWRATREPARLAVFSAAAAAVILCGVYFYWVRFYVVFPADILIWPEGDYVNDIAKFRAGYPLYSAPANNESFTYPPGTQLLTYALASAAGRPASIPAYRFVHVCYTLAAAWIAMLAVRKALDLAGRRELARSPVWNALWAPLLFLIATNSITSRFTQALHDDALSELVSAVAFYLALAYAERPRPSVLAAMAVLPAAGFLVKQSLLIWAGLFTAYLLWFELAFGRGRAEARRRLKPALPPVAVFAAAAFGLALAVFGGCYALWGRDFVFWTMTVVARHAVRPLLSIEHLFDVWAYVAAGLVGGLALVERSPRLLGAWLLWLALMLAECYTSGVAWMVNHIGPGCLLAGVWLCAGMAVGWEGLRGGKKNGRRFAVAVASVLLLAGGLGLVRIPAAPMTADANRYLGEIEKEFIGERPGRVLIDAGSWVTLRQGIVARDRAPSLGERGWSATADFSGLLGRIRGRYYDKILVHGLHSADFWYDEPYWPRRSGVRQALLDNYREAGMIRGAARPASERDHAEDYYLFGDLSVLVPKR